MEEKELDKIKTILCPPGAGVFTVNTAKEKKSLLYQQMYKTVDDIETKWKNSLGILNSTTGTVVLGVCSDTGGGIQRGANWGPLYLRETLLQDHPNSNYFDIGDIRVIPHLLHDKYLNDETIKSCRDALYNDPQSQHSVSPLSLAKEFCDLFHRNTTNTGLFSIGGDHSVSYPLVKSWLEYKNSKSINVGILHFDAHTDLLRTRLGIDLCFGSWLTHVLPELSNSKNCYQFGIRSSGKNKEHWEKEFGINQYWTQEVKKYGAINLARKVKEELLERGVEELYVSFDIDAIDSSIAGATGTPEPNGLMPHECLIILKEINSEIKITGADMVEIAPQVGNDQLIATKTLQAAGSISSYLIEAINNAYC